jgi:hypothetical protein
VASDIESDATSPACEGKEVVSTPANNEIKKRTYNMTILVVVVRVE